MNRPLRSCSRRGAPARLALAAALAVGLPPAVAAGEAPATLAETGLYADLATRTLAPGVLPFEPQYPLWSDGAHKRRWILLPPGTAIDASDPDVWSFPVGTRLWKEFSLACAIETRYMERLADGTWRFATYLWDEADSTAALVPARGLRRVAESAPGVPYDLPSVTDCRACHAGHPAIVLGFSALQLSGDRDPRAPHAVAPPAGTVDLAALVARGLVTGLPPTLAALAPRVHAASPEARAALGYLHGNCSGCHNARGPLAELGLSLAVRADGEPEALATAVGVVARYRPAGHAEVLRIAPGAPEKSLLVERLTSRQAVLQMPPMSTRTVDHEALALVTEWIRTALAARPQALPPATLAAGSAAPSKENHR